MPHDLAAALKAALTHLKTELDTIRTGRANPSIIENVNVEAYGSMMPLQQLATITVPEPRVLLIQPWDASTVKDIERALSASSVGITPVVDGKNIRLPFPSMTEERRREMVKMVHEKAEQCRVRVRQAREETMKDLKRAEADGDQSQDEVTLAKARVQQDIDAAIKEIESLLVAKEQEIMTV